MRRDPSNSHHLATVSYDGRFWDAYLELVEPSPGQRARGRIAFSAADAGHDAPVRTATIFIENTSQEVLARAREFKTHQLVALLRSAIEPGPGADPTSDAEPPGPGKDPGTDPGDEPPPQGEPADTT